ncbi:pancreatic secretory granule membrane major glycoprotein GP2-like isoform X2 [Montipora foliosa]|uniref:pancreatic secretory granule membrane major glycoprotein GP2-like isoform X2 n=1 Tax=Montipora foliosa TaxID=591990 RepID=UPI0035F2143B
MAEKAERGLEIRTRRRDRKRKAETKTSNGVGDEGKEEREGGREKSPCVKEPCYNKGTCSPISYRDGTYRCTCHPGYLGRFCETAPPECASYTVLNGTKRHHMNDAGFSYSDHNLIKSWYRFQGNGYTRMVDRCISYYHFGGRTPGWLKGGHPSLADGIVQRTACFHIRNNCCNYRRAIRVRNCGDYYVYELRATRSSGHVYCTTS